MYCDGYPSLFAFLYHPNATARTTFLQRCLKEYNAFKAHKMAPLKATEAFVTRSYFQWTEVREMMDELSDHGITDATVKNAMRMLSHFCTTLVTESSFGELENHSRGTKHGNMSPLAIWLCAYRKKLLSKKFQFPEVNHQAAPERVDLEDQW